MVASRNKNSITLRCANYYQVKGPGPASILPNFVVSLLIQAHEERSPGQTESKIKLVLFAYFSKIESSIAEP